MVFWCFKTVRCVKICLSELFQYRAFGTQYKDWTLVYTLYTHSNLEQINKQHFLKIFGQSEKNYNLQSLMITLFLTVFPSQYFENVFCQYSSNYLTVFPSPASRRTRVNFLLPMAAAMWRAVSPFWIEQMSIVISWNIMKYYEIDRELCELCPRSGFWKCWSLLDIIVKWYWRRKF